MPPKKSQLKQNASYKPSKKVKKAGAKAKAVDDPLMVFEFESDDDGEVVVTPLRPRGAVPTPKQISGQSSDGNDPLTDDRLSPADRSGADDTEEEEDEEGSSEPEDVLVGIAQERSPATALCRKRAGVKPRGGMTRCVGNKRVKSDDFTGSASLTSPVSSAVARGTTAASQDSAVDGPSIFDPLETTASKVRVPGKRGRKPGAATMTKTPPHVTKTSPHVTKTPPQQSPQSGEVKRKRGRPRKNPLPPPPPSSPPSSPPPPPPPPPPPSQPSRPTLQLSPFASSPTVLVALEAALIEAHPLSESPVQVEVHDSEGGIVAHDDGAPVPTEVTPQQPEPIVVKRKRGRPRKTPLPPPPQPVAMETPLSEDSRVFKSPVPAGGVSEDVRPPQQGSIQGEFSDTESPLAGVSSCKVETVESLGKDTPTTGGVSVESEEVQPKATPTGEVPDTPTKVALQKESHGENSHPMEASSGPYGTSVESCDAPAGPGDSTPDLRVKPEDFAPGSVPVMAGSVASRSDVMETDCAGAKGVSSASVRGSNIRQCERSVQPPPPSSEYPGGGEAEEDGEEEKHGDTTTEEELEEDGEEEKVEEPRPNRFMRPGVKAITSFSVTKSAEVPSITRSSTWPSRAADTEKGVPTVLRNVKQAHECQLLGESQQHIDELYFLLDSIGPAQSPCMRALATCGLAQQCLANEFRHIIKDKKLLSKMFARLKDGTGDPGIRLAIAVLAYVLSRDKSNQDWSCEVADLLVSVMSLERQEVDGEEVITLGKDSKDYLRVLNKARKVVGSACSMEMAASNEVKGEEGKGQKPGDSYKINEQDISVPELVCEVFLIISTPQSSCQWLREQLRASGGLDLIANMVITDCNFVEHKLKGRTGEEDAVVISGRLCAMERQLKCLENATFMNKTNQSYLVVFDGSLLLSKLTKLLLACEAMMDKAELRKVSQECLVSITKLLLNLTHDNELGSCRLGQQAGLLGAVLHIVFKLPSYIREEEHFDILVLGLGLLINLTELSAPNRQQLQILTITPQSATPGEEDPPPRGYPFLGPLAQLFLKHHGKVEKATIDVPTPQRLSQLTSQESQGSSKGGQGPNQQTTTFSERLKLLKMAKKTPKAEMREPGDLVEAPDERGDKEECEGSSVQIDPLVFSREDFDNALSQAGRHMEDSILAAYTALLLGILAKHHHDCVDHVKNEMPSKSFAEMLEDLHRFVSFMSMTGAPSGLESVRHIIKYLEVM